MHYSGLTYRPPYEATSLLLQVTSGCSHNSCTFCTMYDKVRFRESPLSEIENDVWEASLQRAHATRVFLENGDAFCLPAERLLEIAEIIRAKLPNVREITGYARIPNIIDKTDEELRALAEAGFTDFNFGVESALDDVLDFMNKGYDVQTAREQLERLNEAGMPFSVNIINAAAGPGRIAEHAAANAAFVNEVQPYLVFVSPLHIDPGSKLESIVAAGGFEESTLGEYIEEEIAFLEGLDLNDCTFFGLHVSNPVPVLGQLPKDKEALLDALRDGMERIPRWALDSHPSKGAEGRLYL